MIILFMSVIGFFVFLILCATHVLTPTDGFLQTVEGVNGLVCVVLGGLVGCILEIYSNGRK